MTVTGNLFRCDSMGMTGFNLKSSTPRFSTPMALKLGHLATKGAVEIQDSEVWKYFAGASDIPAGPPLIPGSTIVRCDGKPLGLGNISVIDGKLESLFPKIWGGVQIRERIAQIV